MKFIGKVLTDWVLGIILTLLVLLGYLFNWYPFMAVEYKAYDFRAKLRQQEIEKQIVIVAIDDGSINAIGQWPWPRKYMATLIDNLSAYGARVIGVNVLYTEAIQDPGQQEIRAIKEAIEGMPGYDKNEQLMQVYWTLEKAERGLDNDNILTGSLEFSENVVLPLYLVQGEKLDKRETELPEFAEASSIPVGDDTDYISATNMVTPIPQFASVAMGLGHTNLVSDEDGTVRKEVLLFEYAGRYYPSFALQTVLKYLDFDVSDIDTSDGLAFGKVHIPADSKNRMLVRYNGKAFSFPYFPFANVYSDIVPESEFEDKIVLVGAVGTGIGSFEVTPIEHGFPPVEIIANVIENILSRDFLSRPDWARYAEIGAMVLFGLFLSLLLPRVKAGVSAVIAFFLFVLWNGAAVYLFVSKGFWIMMFHPSLLLGLGYTVIVSKRFMVTEKKKELVETDSIETNKMLGLSFQGQGLLDMALDKFMKCPIEDESIKEYMYNLALDFERKRMFNKAVSVYEHISKAGKFKDVEEKIKKLTAVGETMIFGAPGATKADATLVVDGASSAPTLGRYEVQKELGRGAMGIVYLGKDPTINRQVAIKTVRFDEVEEEQIKEVKERFFREAEAAGRLSHPNIVTIYDAGEDYDLAYVAMELLDGMDLSDYIQKSGKKLPVKTAMRIVANVAAALDYAHTNGVVHRDIKPANIMLLKNGAIKVTDFGIARVVATSKTQTGVVLGTPSYMSPEQVLGKKVDGRSDIFSLGVMLYELISGTKPFSGDSVATLMYNIANNPHPSLREIVPDVPECCMQILEKFLEKDVEKRYQKAREPIRDIKACLQIMG